MSVRVLFFSVLRDAAGCGELERAIAPGASVATLLEELMRELPRLRGWEGRILVAVDEQYAGPETALRDGQEVAIMPPVQGG